MKTKADLLTKMAELNACLGATAWATSQDGTALEIGLRCERIDWLIWLIGRIDPTAIAVFALLCADRAKAYANANANAAARYAANAAADAAYAAYAAYAASAAERKQQLTDLHAVWAESGHSSSHA